MNDSQSSAGPSSEVSAWFETERAHARRVAEVLPHNKAVLFDALAAAGIAVVTVFFDGYGDSGQIEEVQAKTGDLVIAFPPDLIEIAEVDWGADTPRPVTLSMREAIERLAYSFLAETHAGWENNDGAYGDFAFDVAERTITLDYNERHMESDNSQHAF
jgi:hypothetical protein